MPQDHSHNHQNKNYPQSHQVIHNMLKKVHTQNLSHVKINTKFELHLQIQIMKYLTPDICNGITMYLNSTTQVLIYIVKKWPVFAWIILTIYLHLMYLILSFLMQTERELNLFSLLKLKHWLAWFTTHILLEYSLNYFLQSIYQILLTLSDLWNDSSSHQLCLFERILQNYYCLVFFWSCLCEDIQSDFVFVPQKSAIWKNCIHV